MTEPTNEHHNSRAAAPPPHLYGALEGLLGAIDAVNAALPYIEDQPEGESRRWPPDPQELLWTAQRTALAAEELGHLVARIGDYAAEWATFITGSAEMATIGSSRHSATTYLARVRELPQRLHAASRAMALAARRGSLDELQWFIQPPRIHVKAGDLGGVDVELVGEEPPRYGVRDARPGPTPLHARERRDTDSGGLVAAIAAALDADLADTRPHRRAREAAERAPRTGRDRALPRLGQPRRRRARRQARIQWRPRRSADRLRAPAGLHAGPRRRPARPAPRAMAAVQGPAGQPRRRRARARRPTWR